MNLTIELIKTYQRKLSPILNRKRPLCRFYPSCSNYAILAIEKYGTFIGISKTFDRLIRCNPYNFNSCVDFP